MNLALFDFDGTITTQATYTKFIIASTPKLRLLFGYVIIFPVIILYKCRLLSASKVRPLITWISFKNRKQSDIGYNMNSHGVENASHIDMTWPHAAGSLLSTVGDMDIWFKALRSGKLISITSYQQMIVPFKLNDGSLSNYGFGLRIDKLISTMQFCTLESF